MKNLKYYREKIASLSVDELAKLAEVSPDTIVAAENNKRQIQPKKRRAIAAGLNKSLIEQGLDLRVTVELLMGESETSPKTTGDEVVNLSMEFAN